MRLSIIVPVLNEASLIADRLAALEPLQRRGAEVIVVDGGSSDSTVDAAQDHADLVVAAARGRATQMNAGASVADGEVLLFLHADSCLPPQADRIILDAMAVSGRKWGRFDVRIDGRHPLLPVIAFFMNWRSRLTGICTGDQGIFVRRDVFEACGGFPSISLMEDIALSRILKRRGRPRCLGRRIVTSGRRWELNGTWRTMFLMWRLRLAYFLGADPRHLAARYDRGAR